MRTIDRVKKRYVEEGLDSALKMAPTSRVYEKLVDGGMEAHLVALACGEPPQGFARWSLRLLADKLENFILQKVFHMKRFGER
jgi:hypothetical protein